MTHPTPPTEGRVVMRQAIEIDRPAPAVFDFISDGTKDPSWRSEVYRMDVSGPPAPGAQWTEYSRFYGRYETVTPTAIKEFDPPRRVLLETPRTHHYWLHSIREVMPLSEGRSRLVYELAFDPASMKQLLPFVPPNWIIKAWYAPRIRKYLGNAKRVLEI
jgi:Polyketide cyclase / dehydrase and lipid transport